MVPKGAAKKVWKAVQSYLVAKQHQDPQLTPYAITAIAAAVKTAVKEEIGTHAKPGQLAEAATTSIWASVSGKGKTANIYEIAQGPVPSRHDREIMIQARQATDDIKKRTSIETVQAVNLAIKTDAVVAARRLPSGDKALTFRDKAKSHLENTEWIQTAFGAEAHLKRRTYTIIAKGSSKSYRAEVLAPRTDHQQYV